MFYSLCGAAKTTFPNHGTMEALQTLTKSTSILMSGIHNRWLTGREILTVQGFPVDTKNTHGWACSSYALRTLQQRRGLMYDPWPTRHSLCEHAGDSMHTSVSGLVFLFALTQVIISTDVLRVQHFAHQQHERLALVSGCTRLRSHEGLRDHGHDEAGEDDQMKDHNDDGLNVHSQRIRQPGFSRARPLKQRRTTT